MTYAGSSASKMMLSQGKIIKMNFPVSSYCHFRMGDASIRGTGLVAIVASTAPLVRSMTPVSSEAGSECQCPSHMYTSDPEQSGVSRVSLSICYKLKL